MRQVNKLNDFFQMSKEIKNAKVSDLVFDDKNFNKHTEFGMSLLERSLRQHGAGRSILIDKNNRIIGGNGVVETAAQIGLDDVQIVESDGSKIIAVKRTDIDLDTKQGREMALADNATAAADLEWDAETIAEVEAEYDLDVSGWGVDLDAGVEITSGPRDNTKGFVKVTLMLTDDEEAELNALCRAISETREIAILTALRGYEHPQNDIKD